MKKLYLFCFILAFVFEIKAQVKSLFLTKSNINDFNNIGNQIESKAVEDEILINDSIDASNIQIINDKIKFKGKDISTFNKDTVRLFKFPTLYYTQTGYRANSESELLSLLNTMLSVKKQIEKEAERASILRKFSTGDQNEINEKERRATLLQEEAETYRQDALRHFFNYRYKHKQLRLFPTIAYQYIKNESSEYYYSSFLKSFTIADKIGVFSQNSILYSPNADNVNIISEVLNAYVLAGKLDVSFGISNIKDSVKKQVDSLNSIINSDNIAKQNEEKLIAIATNSGNLSFAYSVPLLFLKNKKGSFFSSLEFSNRFGCDIPNFNSSKMNIYNRTSFPITLNAQITKDFSFNFIFRPSVVYISPETKKYLNLAADAFNLYETNILIKLQSIGFTFNIYNTELFLNEKGEKHALGSKMAAGFVFFLN